MSNKESKQESKSGEKAITPVMPQIKTVVMLMLENRSLDNLLGFLYPDGKQPKNVYPKGSSPDFNGVKKGTSNSYHGKKYEVTNGTVDNPLGGSALQMPDYDPHEEFAHVGKQLYADDRGNMPDGYFWKKTPTMTGFAWDYDEIWTANQAIMGAYSADQLPAMHGLAKNYAVSDRWFSSIPTQTDPNRAYSLCGTSRGIVINKEIEESTFASSPTIFNKLGEAGKSWGLYWQSEGIASGAPLHDVFTPYYFSQMNKAPNGGVHKFNDPKDDSSFMQSLAAGTLPEFCYLEPKWGGGPVHGLGSIQGNDYHPAASVGPAEYDLNELYEALIKSPQWDNMLFIVTFDEHGGTYDHEPPPTTITPDGIVGESGFKFDRLGVRVPTLLISPFIKDSVVFRSPTPGVDFDHSSFISTLLSWAGVDPKTAGMGARVAQAPTFDGVLSSSARKDKPTFTVPPAYAKMGHLFEEVVPTPKDENGDPLPSKPMHLHQFREACDASSDSEDFVKRLLKLRYGV